MMTAVASLPACNGGAASFAGSGSEVAVDVELAVFELCD